MPVYEQIRAQVARLAASGQVAPGTRMPTIRQLASDLGLAKGTIERSYELLETDGIVKSRGRSGTFVLGPSLNPANAAIGEGDLAASADAFAVVAIQAGVSDSQAVEELRKALGRLRN